MGSMLKKMLAVGAVPSLAIALALPGAIAATGAAAPARAAVRAVAMPSAAGPRTRVIVMLRDRESGLAPRTAARGNALRAEEAPLCQACPAGTSQCCASSQTSTRPRAQLTPRLPAASS